MTMLIDVSRRKGGLLRHVAGCLAIALICVFPSLSQATAITVDKFSPPVSVVIPISFVEGQVSSRPVSVAIPTGFEGQFLSHSVSVKVQPANTGDVDLVGLWHMDGDWADSSGNENDGRAANGATFSNERMIGSQSGSFDGTNDYVEVANSLAFRPAQLTLAVWVKPQLSGVDKAIATNEPLSTTTKTGFGIRQTIDNQFKFVLGKIGTGTAALTTIPFELGQWYFVAGTFDGSDIKIYVNGAYISHTPCTSVVNTDAAFRFGYLNSSTEAFNGLLDEVSFYKRALTAEQIQSLYNNTVLSSRIPDQPTVNEPYPRVTASTSLLLTGTKPAGTSLWVKGLKQVDLNDEITWQATVSLNYGSNLIGLITKNEHGIDSNPVTLPILMDNVAPLVTTKVPVDGSVTRNNTTSVSFALSDQYSNLDLGAIKNSASVTNETSGLSVNGDWTPPITVLTKATSVVFTPQAAFADGTYVAAMIPKDDLGNSAVETRIRFTVDTNPPDVPVIMPPTGPVSSSVTLNGTKAADAATILVTSSRGTVSTVSYPTNTSWRVTLSNLIEGELTVTSAAKDVAGNSSNSATLVLTVDTTPPAAPTVSAVASPTKVTTVNLSGTKEFASRLFINNQEYADFYAAESWSVTRELNEDANSFTLYAKDLAGNQSASVPVSVVRDTTAPTIGTATPATNTVVIGTDTISVLLSDSHSGINLDASLSDALVKDSAGAAVSGTWTVVDAALVFTPALPFVDGIYTVVLHPVDGLGNIDTTGGATFSFTIDAALPTVKTLVMSPLSPHKAETVTFSLTFSEAMKTSFLPTVTLVRERFLLDARLPLSGAWLNATTWRGSHDFLTNSPGDGEYQVTVAGAKDLAGNIMSEQSAGTFILDTEVPAAPSLSLVTTPTKVATQILTGAKPVATALFINGQQKVALNDETTWSLSYPLKEGNNPLSLVSRDAAGNDSPPLTTSILLDTTPPAFTIEVWQPVSSQPTQILSGSREPGSIVKLEDVVIAGAEDLSGSWSCPVTLVEGIATRLTFTASDGLGNVVTRTIDVLYDALAPPALVAGALSADGNGSGTSVKLTWPAYVEPADLAYYRVYLASADFTDIGGRVAVGTANKGSKTYTALGLSEGMNYFFAVEPVDISGNSESAVHTATAIPVDAAPPEEVTGLKAVAAYNAASGNSVTLTWTASKDSRGDLAEQLLYVDAGLGYAVGTPLGQTVVSHSVTGLTDATLYKFKITTKDAGGHESAGTIVQAVTRLANPTGLVAVAGKNQVTLHWNAVASPYLASYQVYRLVSDQIQQDATAMTVVKSLTSTSWTDTGLTNGTTYQYAVTAVNTSGAERTQVQSIGSTPRQDADGPVIGSFNLSEGQVVVAPRTVEATASDLESAMAKVEIYLDGALIVTGSGGSVSWYWNVVEATDGNHTVKIVATDTIGNATEVSRTVVVSLAPPATPQITTHLTESTAPVYTVKASGSAPLYSAVSFRVNGVVLGSAVASATGTFNFSGLPLVEGENRLAVKATHRGGDSPWSADYRITVDTGAPAAPIELTPKALAGGTVQFTWLAGAGEMPTGYNLYQGVAPFTTSGDSGVSRVNTTPIGYLLKEAIPVNDSVRYYAVTALDGAGNESGPSNVVAIASDRSLPMVTAVTFATVSGAPTTTLTTGPGTVTVDLTVSEPLRELPFFSLESQAGSPIIVSLTKTDDLNDLNYSGSFMVDATSLHGPTAWKFSGKDVIGNRGSQQGIGPVFDVRGPVATVTVPVGLQKIAADVPVEISFDEVPITTPVLEFTDAVGTVAPVMGLVQTSDPRHWGGTFDLSALSEGEGSFRLLSATDSFGNLSTAVADGQKLLLYRDVPPAPAVPLGLTAVAKPGGRIELLWKVVTGATSYRLYRRAEGESNFTLLATQTATGYSDLTAQDGRYSYAVSAVGLLDSASELCTEVWAIVDRTAPDAPADLALLLQGSGVKATWSAPTGDPPASYRLYRAGSAFVSVSGLTAVATAPASEAVDAAPSSTLRHYAVTALDALGNESAPSANVSIDFPVAPVKNLVLTQLEGGKPTLTWEAPQSGLQGYYIYRNGQKITAAPTPGTTFTDGYYASGLVTYGISALDTYGNESPVRELSLPELAISLPAGTVLRRGLLETVPVMLTSPTTIAVKELRLKVGSAAENLLPGPFALTAGEAFTVQKVVATALDAASTVAVVGTAVIEPAPGTTLRITRTSLAQVAPAGTALELFNEPLIRGTSAQVRLKVNNLGSAQMELLTSEAGGPTGEVKVSLTDQDGNLLAEGSLNQRLGTQVVDTGSRASARIEPGASFLTDPIVFTIPLSAPTQVNLTARIASTYFHLGRTDQVVAPGLTQAVSVVMSEVAYGATAQVEKEIYQQGEAVLITGRAITSATGEPMPGVPVKIGLSVNGFDRTFTALADDTGVFNYTFSPAAGEAGFYSVWAAHPDVADRSVQDRFAIVGLKVSPTLVNVKMSRNKTQDIPVTLKNPGDAPLTGLSFVTEASTGISAEVLASGLATLAGGESRIVTFRLTSGAEAPESGFAALTVTSAEGVSRRIDANLTLVPALPLIVTSPSLIDTGMVRGSQKVASFTLKNAGLETLKNARIEGPSIAWMSLTVGSSLGDVPIGGSRTIGLLLKPGTAVPPGIYDDRLVIVADNHIPYTFNVQVSVTSEAMGNVYFDVQNEFYDKLVGASVVVQNQQVPELILNKTTGVGGTLFLPDLPEGRYSFNISAAGHLPYGSSFTVEPGVTRTVPVALQAQLIDIEWSVVPTVIQDRYEVKITQTFATNVPAPVLVAEPAGVTLPAIAPGEVFNGEFAVTNYGLIAVEDVKLGFPASVGDYDIEVFADTIPERIGAKETIRVAYRVTRRASLVADTTLFDEVAGYGGSPPTCGVNTYLRLSGIATICPNSDFQRTTNADVNFSISGECYPPDSLNGLESNGQNGSESNVDSTTQEQNNGGSGPGSTSPIDTAGATCSNPDGNPDRTGPTIKVTPDTSWVDVDSSGKCVLLDIVPKNFFVLKGQKLPAAFTGYGANTAGCPITWEWDFGNGETSNERYAAHYYPEIGTYAAKLTVSCLNCTPKTQDASHKVVVFDLHLFDGAKEINKQNPIPESVFIDPTPQMPNLKAKLEMPAGVVKTVKWQISTLYDRKQTYTDSNGKVTSDGKDTFPPAGPRVLSSSTFWNLANEWVDKDSKDIIRGGTATLTFDIEGGYANDWSRTFQFKILGKNPAKEVAKNEINRVAQEVLGSVPWFVIRLAKGESGTKDGSTNFFQFNETTLNNNEPNAGGNGWGIFQLDPPPNADTLWNWKKNTKQGMDKLKLKRDYEADEPSQGKPERGAIQFWDDQVEDYFKWQNDPLNKDKIPSRDPKITYNDITFCYPDSKGMDSKCGTNSKSMMEAIWLKQYNSADKNFISWAKKSEEVEFNWHFNTSNAKGFNYVERVCNENDK